MSSRGWKGWGAGSLGSVALHGGVLALALALLDDGTSSPSTTPGAEQGDDEGDLDEPSVTIEVEASLDPPPEAGDEAAASANDDDDDDDVPPDDVVAANDDNDNDNDNDSDGDFDDDIDPDAGGESTAAAASLSPAWAGGAPFTSSPDGTTDPLDAAALDAAVAAALSPVPSPPLPPPGGKAAAGAPRPEAPDPEFANRDPDTETETRATRPETEARATRPETEARDRTRSPDPRDGSPAPSPTRASTADGAFAATRTDAETPTPGLAERPDARGAEVKKNTPTPSKGLAAEAPSPGQAEANTASPRSATSEPAPTNAEVAKAATPAATLLPSTRVVTTPSSTATTPSTSAARPATSSDAESAAALTSPDAAAHGSGHRARRDEPVATGDDNAKQPASGEPGERGRGGEGGARSWFMFVRSDAPVDADAVVEGTSPYIGDRNVVVDVHTRAPTTTRRSLADGTSRDEALPVPEEMESDSRAEIAVRTPERESPSPVSGSSQLEGTRSAPTSTTPPPPGGVRLWIEADYSEKTTAPSPSAPPRHRKATPALVPAEVAEKAPGEVHPPEATPKTEPLHAAITPRATAAQSPRLDDDFWTEPLFGTGEGDTGSGTASSDSPASQAGADVAKVIYKRDGAAWIDLAVVDERVEKGETTQVSVSRTALGTWFVPVDDLVRATWQWPEAEKALGVRGRVVVEFTIAEDGRVSDVALVDANVPLSMQEAALEAIPAAVAPPPEGEGPLRVRYVFRYGD